MRKNSSPEIGRAAPADLPKTPENVYELALQFPHYIRDGNDFKCDKEISRGKFGINWSGVDIKTGKSVIVKEFTHQKMDKVGQRKFINEVFGLALTNSRFITPLVGFTVEPPFTIITEYVSNETLKSKVFTKSKVKLSGTHKTTIAMTIAFAMIQVHKKYIILRDLRLGSILLDSKGMPRLGDFSLCRIWDPHFPVTRRIGSISHMAPEVMHNDLYSCKADVYSFGILLLELAEEGPAYPLMTTQEIIEYMKSSDLRPDFRDTDRNMRNLIDKCWSSNPDDRPSFEKIFEWFVKGKYSYPGTESSKVKAYAEKMISNQAKRDENQAGNITVYVNVQEVMRKLIKEYDNVDDLDKLPEKPEEEQEVKKEVKKPVQTEFKSAAELLGNLKVRQETPVFMGIGSQGTAIRGDIIVGSERDVLGEILNKGKMNVSTEFARGNPEQLKRQMIGNPGFGEPSSFCPLPPMPGSPGIQPPPFQNAGLMPLGAMNISAFDADADLCATPATGCAVPPEFLDYVKNLMAAAKPEKYEAIAGVLLQQMGASDDLAAAALIIAIKLAANDPTFIDAAVRAKLLDAPMPSKKDTINVVLAFVTRIVIDRPQYLHHLLNALRLLITMRPRGLIHIFAEFAEHMPDFESAFPVIDFFLEAANVYVATAYGTDYLKVMHLMFSSHAEIFQAREEQIASVLCLMQSSIEAGTKDMCYRVMCHLIKNVAIRDFEPIISALSTPGANVDILCSVLLRMPALPPSRRLANAILELAKTSEKWACVLFKFASFSEKTAAILQQNNMWMQVPLPTYEHTAKLLFIMFSHPNLRQTIVSDPAFSYVLNLVVETKNHEIIIAIPSILKRASLNGAIFASLSQGMFLNRYFNYVYGETDEALVNSSFVTLDMLSRIGFHQSYIFYIQKLVSTMSTNPNLSGVIISLYVVLSALPECREALKQVGLVSYFESLLGYAPYKPYAETFLANVK